MVAKFAPKPRLLIGIALLLAVLMGLALISSTILVGDEGPYVVVAVLVAAAGGLAVLLQWRLGVLLLAATLPFENILTFGGSVTAIRALALFTFLSLGLALLRDRKQLGKLIYLLQQPLVISMFALSLWALASVLWANVQGPALVKASTFLGLLGLVLSVGLLEKRYLSLVWVILALSAVLSVPLGGYSLSKGSETLGEAGGRFTSGGLSPNDYAGLLIIVVFVSSHLWMERFKAVGYLLALPILLGVLLSGSRTALVAFLATPLLLLFVPAARRRAMKFILLVASFLVGVSIVLFFAFPSTIGALENRYATLFEYQDSETWAGRWDLWQAAFQIISSNPLQGIGIGNFPYVSPMYSEKALQMQSLREGAASAHNVFLGITSEMGLVGLMLLLGILVFAFRQTLKVASRNRGLEVSLLFGLVAFSVMSLATPWEVEKIGYFLYGSVLSLQLNVQVAENAIRDATS